MPKPYVYTGFVKLNSDETRLNLNEVENKNHKEFPTYAELKRNLKQLIENSPENKVTVHRFRRGEWGEWFEKWIMLDDKPIKIDEGWM